MSSHSIPKEFVCKLKEIKSILQKNHNHLKMIYRIKVTSENLYLYLYKIEGDNNIFGVENVD